MAEQGREARGGRPVIALSRHDPASVAELRSWLLHLLDHHRSGAHTPVDPGPMAPHSHADGTAHTH
jgi:urease accessory protein